MRSRYICCVVSCLFLISIFIMYLSRKQDIDCIKIPTADPEFLQARDQYWTCIVEQLRVTGDSFNNLPAIVSFCLTINSTIAFNIRFNDVLPLRNHDEFKFIIPSNDTKERCVEVTLGIGKDVRAEAKLLEGNFKLIFFKS